MSTMALNIRNIKAEQLAAELAQLTGESKTEAVTRALEERLSQVRKGARKRHIVDRLNEIAEHCSSLPVLDKRSANKMLYDKRGLPS